MSIDKTRALLKLLELSSTLDNRRAQTNPICVRPSRLAACLALALPLCAMCDSMATAATRTVTNCNDAGIGSLREAALAAQDDDVIQFNGLQCSTISLMSGEIPLAARNVTITGPGASALTIEANHFGSRIFAHAGSGVLTINNLKLYAGYAEDDTAAVVKGGCVYSTGSIVVNNSVLDYCGASVSYLPSAGTASGGALSAAGYIYLHNSSITHSTATSTIGSANGGAIYAGGDVYLNDSTLSANFAGSYSGATARGGAIFAVGNIVMNRSTIAGNVAYSPHQSLAGPSYGGGIYVKGFARGARGTQISNSTISGNQSHNVGGVEILDGGGISYNANIVNSTISTNYANNRSGGIAISTPLTLSNSTVAFNGSHGSSVTAAGLEAYSAPVLMQSSILAYNYAQSVYFDFDAGFVTGSNNLITHSSIAPSNTITANPQLLPLANNGGPTKTHALQANSPAIGHGNNVVGLAFDQRGPGFPRVLGTAPDIGAVEGDRIFANGFEGLQLMREEDASSARAASVLAYRDALIPFAEATGKHVSRARRKLRCEWIAPSMVDASCP